MKNKHNTYTLEFKEQCVKEALDIGKVSVVARKHKIHQSILHRWINEPKYAAQKKSSLSNLELRKRLDDAELENRVLKELLKKTNQAWLKD